MIIPIRCFTCNKIIAHKWEEYINKIQKAYLENENKNNVGFIGTEELIQIYENTLSNKNPNNASIEATVLNEMKFNRYCCRRMFLAHVDMCDKI